MSNHNPILTKILEKKEPGVSASKAIAMHLDTFSSKEAPVQLAALCEGENINLMGYHILPSILPRLVKDKAFFLSCAEMLTKRSQPSKGMPLPKEFRMVTLDTLDSAIKRNKTNEELKEGLMNALHKIALNGKDMPIAFRKRAIKMLIRYPVDSTRNVFENLIKIGKLENVDAIAIVLRKWNQVPLLEKNRYQKELTASIVEYTDKKPRTSLKSQGIIALLATLNTAKAKSAFNKVVALAKTEQDWLKLSTTLGYSNNTDLLLKFLNKLKDSKGVLSPLSTEILKGYLSQNPDVLKNLFDSKQKEAFLRAVDLCEDLDYLELGTHISALCRDDSPSIAYNAARIANNLTDEVRSKIEASGIKLVPKLANSLFSQNRQRSLFYQGVIGVEKYQEIVANIPPSGLTFLQEVIEIENLYPQIDPSVINPEYGTLRPGIAFANKADAMYCNLSEGIQDAGFDNHWHAGIFTGIDIGVKWKHSKYIGDVREYKSDVRLRAVHMNSTVDTGLGPQEFSVNTDNLYPEQYIKEKFELIYNKLLEKFHEGSGFKGFRSSINIGCALRKNICITAYALINQNIWYCFSDMMKFDGYDWWFGSGWDGSPGDIDELRCDGVVEYSYEKNDIKVCSGIDEDLWNISHPGDEYPDNHNLFHTNIISDYDHGEICPRIQAGAGHGCPAGTGSTFRIVPAQAPIIEEFTVSPDVYGMIPPSIHFKVRADMVEKIYVRITVRKDGGPFYYIMADDLIIDELPFYNTPVGAMTFMRLDKLQAILWLGKTLHGPDFWGKEGMYEFRCVVVDEGGNVSQTVFRKREFKIGGISGWSSTNPGDRISETLTDIK